MFNAVEIVHNVLQHLTGVNLADLLIIKPSFFLIKLAYLNVQKDFTMLLVTHVSPVLAPVSNAVLVQSFVQNAIQVKANRTQI
jgi:hypothetical protein